MSGFHLWQRFEHRLRRERAEHLARREITVSRDVPMVSFTFDDFPTSALRVAGRMLVERQWRGTYYTSFGLAGTVAPTGQIFELADMAGLIEQGHELGCHTFAHLHAWESAPGEFEASIQENQRFLDEHFPGQSFPTLSYPISCPHPAIKRKAGAHFDACRGGGQTFNANMMDLNHLRSFFLEQVGQRLAPVEKVLDETLGQRGWLVFSTHDVDESPTPYGVEPRFFEQVLEVVQKSGACVLPVGAALRRMGVSHSSPAIPQGVQPQ